LKRRFSIVNDEKPRLPQVSKDQTVLYYVHDPMCSWCYAFAPVWESVRGALPEGISLETVLGGLAPDSDTPMPDDMRQKIKGAWQRIESVVLGTEFNYDFWTHCQPRRSTYPACRAVIAAREQGAEHESAMVTAIQRAYYREARNPSLIETLTELAGELGLDASRFEATLVSPECENTLQAEIGRSVSLGVRGFPTLLLGNGGTGVYVKHDYNDANLTAERIVEGIAALEHHAA